ncbi:MAG TPA: hypothetical protein VG228_03810 [Solirubrobacteraceae bacterium]|nr:hypothetical protein [Solirubrobacteraceae bacterium]
MRTVRLLSTVLACAIVALSAVSTASAHSARVLTKSEYQQLQLAQRRIRSLESSDARRIQRADQVCTHMRDVSRLITAVRNGCLDLIRLGGDDAKLNARATHCGIDPPTEAAILTCLVPAVQSYYTDAETFYRAESYVDRLARARGFNSTCVAVIGDSPDNIAAEGRLAGDLKAAVQALKSQNPQALQTLSGQIEAAVRAIRPGPSSLALCPHV